jgi:hypothetical protein
METRVTLRPGDKGTKKLVQEFGQKLLCVRYRYDPVKRMRHKTVELVVESARGTLRGSPWMVASGRVGAHRFWSAFALSIARRNCGVGSRSLAGAGCPSSACGCFL